MELFVIAVIWLIIAPFFILTKIGSIEKRINQNLEKLVLESEKRLGQRLESCVKELSERTVEAAVTRPQQPKKETYHTPLSLKAQEVLRERADLHEPEASKEFNVTQESNVMHEPDVFQPLEILHVFDSEKATGEKEPESAASIENDRDPLRLSQERQSEYAARMEPDPAMTVYYEATTAATVKKQLQEEQMPIAEEPREPGIIELTIQRFLSWLLTEGNIWVCAGVLLFFAGFGFLFSYAVQIGVLTLEMRLAAAALTGIIMTACGFLLRGRRRAFALILQGGGMGVLYLVVLGAAKLTPSTASVPIITPAFAVIAMLALSFFTVAFALLQNYQPLAIFAILGGFCAPIIIRTGSQNYAPAFYIFTLLNLEILAISFMRDWRVLHRLGFVLSVVMGTLLCYLHWKPGFFDSSETFLLAFLMGYTIISMNAKYGKSSIIEFKLSERKPDILMAICAPFCFYFLQMNVVSHFTYGMAVTSLGMGLWYLALGALLRREEGGASLTGNRRALSNIFMLLCLLFSNLAIPYIFEDSISSAIWAAEGAFLIAIACRNGDYGMLFGGIAIHAGAIWIYSHELARLDLNTASKLSPLLFSGIMFTASLLISGFWASRFRPAAGGLMREKWEKTMHNNFISHFKLDGEWVRSGWSWTFTILGTLWWSFVMYDQIPRLEIPWLSPFFVSCLASLICYLMSARLDWSAARFPLLLTVASAFVLEMFRLAGPIGSFGLTRFLITVFSRSVLPLPINADELREISLITCANAAAYLVGVGGSVYLMRRTVATYLSKVVYFASVFVGLTLTARAAHCLGLILIDNILPIWGPLFYALPLFALLLFLRGAFTKNGINEDYKLPLCLSTGAFMFLQVFETFMSFQSEGDAISGVFIPILNPLELNQAVILASFFLWIKIFVANNKPFNKWYKPLQWGIGILLFVWINQIAARGTWWYWGREPFDLLRVFMSSQCQAIVAIMWGVIGLWAVLFGQKTRSRAIWWAGAGLLIVDLLKLMLLDLRGVATLTRILAFLILGGLFILIGWAAPLPPKEEE